MNNLLILLAIHTLISIVFSTVTIRKNGTQDSIFRFFIVFFLPVFGLLFFIITAIIKRTVKYSDKELKSFLSSVNIAGHIHHEAAIDFESEINTVPMEDTLEFFDNKAKRAYLIYILKKDFSGYVKSLKKAIKSKDSETSHYAASALMEIKADYEIMLDSAEQEYKKLKENKKEPGDLLPAERYRDILKKYIKSGIADRTDYYDYLNKYSELLDFLIDKDKGRQDYFVDKVNTDTELGDYDSAFEYCKMFAKYFPGDENSYHAFLKLFYVLNDYKSFKKVISILKKRKIPVSDKFQHMLAFWEGA